MYVAYTTFVKPSSIGGCLGLAQDVLLNQGLTLTKGADGADGLVIGGNAAISVTIVCVPAAGGTWIVVSTSANDLALAEQARNVIRGMIEGTPVP